MHFCDALSVLSKSSSYAVSTDSDLDQDLAAIKDDLYVEMPIEQDLMVLLDSISEQSRKVIFLCGSSGDGKSELLLRARKLHNKQYIKFHLDATHSFSPHDSAIATLDKLFDEFEAGTHSLVIAINIGMLGNYAEEAASSSIRKTLKDYLETKRSGEGFEFIDFEDYPKYEITQDGYVSDFVSRILQKITSPTSELYKVYEREKFRGLSGPNSLKFINYKLLCNEEVQQVLVELLLKIRLFRNQFITARTLLDLIYELVAGKDYLFNNLFSCSDNEILEKAIEFDPSRLRTKSIDRFLIAYELKSLSLDFDNFKNSLSTELMIRELRDSNSYIRLFYILKFLDIGNKYHQKFTNDFTEKLLIDYLEVYRQHTYYDAVKSRAILRNFYNKELLSAIRGYINKKAPYLEDDQFLIVEYGSYKVISHLKISPDFLAIEKNKSHKGKGYFAVYIRIKDFSENKSDPTVTFNVDINLYELLSRLRAGFRPNKNDRSVVVMLNEIVNRLLNFANQSNKLNFQSDSREIKFIREDECIEVGY